MQLARGANQSLKSMVFECVKAIHIETEIARQLPISHSSQMVSIPSCPASSAELHFAALPVTGTFYIVTLRFTVLSAGKALAKRATFYLGAGDACSIFQSSCTWQN